MNRRLAALSAAVAGALFSLRSSDAGIVADSVVSYTSSQASFNNPAAALGPLNGDTTYGGLNPFNPPFSPNQIVIVPAGGQITLHLSQPLATSGGPTLGVFNNNGLDDSFSDPDGSGLTDTPVSTFDPGNDPTAVVSVSQDGVHFVQLNGGSPIDFSNPTNYFLDSPLSEYYQPLGSVVANQYQPFTGSLGSFNGSTYSQILATLNGSAGGTWLDLSGTGLTSVNDVQFTVPSDAGYRFVLDGVSGSQAAGTQLVWKGGSIWDTNAQNWQVFGTTTTATFSNTTNTTSGDNVLFDDSTAGTNFAINGTVRPTTITFNNSSHTYTLTGANSSSGIAGPGSLTVNGTGTVILSSNNTYTGGTWVNSGKLILTTAAAYPANTALYLLPAGTVKLNAGAGTISVSSLNNAGLIDLTNNSMTVHNGDVGVITAEVAAAYDNGAWDGTSNAGAITSSTAANDPTHLTAVGVATSGTDVLIKYTYYGDASMDGTVGSADYTLIDNGYLSKLTGWQNGDFNYDGVINGSDYTLIDNAFNQQGAAISSNLAASTAQVAGTTSVPEPVAIVLLPALALIGRRRRTVR